MALAGVLVVVEATEGTGKGCDRGIGDRGRIVVVVVVVEVTGGSKATRQENNKGQERRDRAREVNAV